MQKIELHIEEDKKCCPDHSKGCDPSAWSSTVPSGGGLPGIGEVQSQHPGI